MRKLISLGMVFFLVLIFSLVYASSGKVPSGDVKKEQANGKASTVASSVSKITVLSSAEREKMRKVIEKKKISLNGIEWEIEISPLSGKGKANRDMIIFKDGKMEFSDLVKKGFSPTNYTLTSQDSGASVIETMQTDIKGAMVFVRGEVSADFNAIQGIISYPKGDRADDYSFRSVNKKITQ